MCPPEAMDTIKKGGKKWQNQVEGPVLVKAVAVVRVKAEAVEVPACLVKLETHLEKAEIMPPQKVKASN